MCVPNDAQKLGANCSVCSAMCRSHRKGIGTRERYNLGGDEISMITLVICSSLVTKPKGVSTFYTS